MFSKHPKGLIAAALANMGERFGFYIMMAILTLFISAKFGLSETTTGYIYSAFYASIYILALAGGVIADKTKNFKGTILVGLILMAVGYLIIAIPTPTPVPSMALYLGLTCFGLLVIALVMVYLKEIFRLWSVRCTMIPNIPIFVMPVSRYFICLSILELFLHRLLLLVCATGG